MTKPIPKHVKVIKQHAEKDVNDRLNSIDAQFCGLIKTVNLFCDAYVRKEAVRNECIASLQHLNSRIKDALENNEEQIVIINRNDA